MKRIEQQNYPSRNLPVANQITVFLTALLVSMMPAFAFAAEKTDSGYKTPEGGFTHLVLFTGEDDFEPRTPAALLGKLNVILFPAKIETGYFRTWIDKDRLVGGICTNDVAKLKSVIELIPELTLITAEPLNEQSFEEHAAKEQVSLPEPEWTPMKDVKKDAKPLPDGLLQAIQKKRRAIHSAEYVVHQITYDDNETKKNKAVFRFQGKDQWFADIRAY